MQLPLRMCAVRNNVILATLVPASLDASAKQFPPTSQNTRKYKTCSNPVCIMYNYSSQTTPKTKNKHTHGSHCPKNFVSTTLALNRPERKDHTSTCAAAHDHHC
jgi:hypothetical protein